MITLKFGGTSMADARRILASADIIINRGKEDRLSVIVQLLLEFLILFSRLLMLQPPASLAQIM